MKNYIIVGLNGSTLVTMECNTIDSLRKIKPKGRTFDYSMYDLLVDWIDMYSWKLERNKKISLADFIKEIRSPKEDTYHYALEDILIKILESEN